LFLKGGKRDVSCWEKRLQSTPPPTLRQGGHGNRNPSYVPQQTLGFNLRQLLFDARNIRGREGQMMIEFKIMII
jgi:hypothetical protein